ncbi:MAG: hypothetical protein ACQEP1_04705, partial [Nanobdellota archaeon]
SLFENVSRRFDSTEYNGDFVVNFTSANITAGYGRYRIENPYGDDEITNGTFYLDVNDMVADFEGLSLNYSSTDKKAILRASANIFVN